jgi:hypothetical protein
MTDQQGSGEQQYGEQQYGEQQYGEQQYGEQVASGFETLAEWAVPVLPQGILGIPSSVDMLFWAFKRTCIASASSLSPDGAWVTRLDDYLNDSSTPEEDKIQIRLGHGRSPSYYSGGLVLQLNSGAGAMTLDDAVFVRDGSWDPNTYVHEMVHVGQYGVLGPEGFLTAYFGTAAAVILERWATGQATDPMTASPLETAAYGIGNRFDPANAR